MHLASVLFNNKNNMGNLLHLTAVMLIFIWAIGFIALDAGIIIHILLIIALIAFFLAFVQGRRKFG